MMLFKKMIPHPLFSLALFVMWLLLVNSIAPGHMVLGFLFGIFIPHLTGSFWTERTNLCRPGLLLKLMFMVLLDIVTANLVVARLILVPRRVLRPGFIRLPLDVREPLAITLLAGIISLTPGTVSADLSSDRRHLLIHCLDLDDEGMLMTRIKHRYETPIREIFQC